MNLGDKIVVLGSRYNPQLGTYLTGPFLGTVKSVNEKTASVGVKFEKCPEADILPTTYNMYTGCAKRGTKCLYGSMTYALYDQKCASERIGNEIVDNQNHPFRVESLEKMLTKINAFFV